MIRQSLLFILTTALIPLHSNAMLPSRPTNNDDGFPKTIEAFIAKYATEELVDANRPFQNYNKDLIKKIFFNANAIAQGSPEPLFIDRKSISFKDIDFLMNLIEKRKFENLCIQESVIHAPTPSIKCPNISLKIFSSTSSIEFANTPFIKFLCQRIKDNTLKSLTLKDVHLSFNLGVYTIDSIDIGDEGAKAIADALKKNTSLIELNVARNAIKDKGAKAIADALKENTSLIRLNLDANAISDEGAKAIADALKKNTSLIELILTRNAISDEGAKFLAEGLESNVSLQEIELSFNPLGDEGIKAIAEALKSNSVLKKICLAVNEIGVEGAKAMATALTVNKSLTVLDLSSNKIGDEGAKAIAEGIANHLFLQDINLNHNHISNTGATILAEAIQNHAFLESINLNNNDIKNEGIIAIAEALKKNQSIKNIDISYNPFTDVGLEALKDAFNFNKMLQEIEFGPRTFKGKRCTPFFRENNRIKPRELNQAFVKAAQSQQMIFPGHRPSPFLSENGPSLHDIHIGFQSGK